MERLSALDAEFLHLEDSDTPMHIAGTCVFEGTPPTLTQVRSLIAAKLHLVPRYRQRVSAFLATFSGFYFGVYSVTDPRFRQGLADDSTESLREALAVRLLYLNARAAG